MLVVLLSRHSRGTPATPGSLDGIKAQPNDYEEGYGKMRQPDGFTKGHQGDAPTENPYDMPEDSQDSPYAEIVLE